MSRADAAGRRAARRVLPGRGDASDEARAAAHRQLRLQARKTTSPTGSSSARAWSARRAREARRSWSPRRPTDYIKISSGLGEAAPVNIVVLPVLFEDQVLAVIELASFTPFSEVHLRSSTSSWRRSASSLNTIIANMRTEELLEQSQRLTSELQSTVRGAAGPAGGAAADQRGARGEGARCSPQQNRDIEIKNREIEHGAPGARGEGRAARAELQVQVASSWPTCRHELRTPLNSLLILAKLLADNPDGNLTDEAGRVRQHDPHGGHRPARR